MLIKTIFLVTLSLVTFVDLTIATSESSEENEIHRLYTIEGKVYPPDVLFSRPNWQANTRIIVNGGEYIGFVKEDGSFVVHNVASGSYILEVLNSEYTYEPVRVEINTKGKFRARKVNHVQTSLVIQLPYPLKLKPLGRTKYFQMREQWRITDFLFSPMVLMMVLPLVFLMVLPKMLNDPETRKEFEQVQSLTKFEMPEMTDIVSNYFAGQGQHQPKKTNKSSKKRQ